MTNHNLSLVDDPLLTRQQLADLLGCTIQHLENLATRGDGPEMTRIGYRMVRYRQSSIGRWLCERTVNSTTAARRLSRKGVEAT